MSYSLQAKNGIYYAVFRAPDGKGGTKQKWVSTKIPAKRGNKRKADEAAREIVSAFESGKIVAYPKIPFWKWTEDWIEQKRLEVDRVTYEGYRCYYKCHIGPWFKQHAVSLTELSPMDLQNYFNAKAQKPGEHVKGKLSGASLRKHNVILYGSLEEAVKKNIIPYNPAERVTLPRKEKFEAGFYTKEQAAKLLQAIKGTVLEGIVPLTLFYGLRRSEAVGLKWSAVDFENEIFTIENTVVRFSEIVEKQKTKNQASHRTFPMTKEVKDLLLKIQSRQQEMKELMGNCYNDSGYVFTWDDGRMLTPDYVTRKFSKILKENGLPHIRYHDLRHSCTSLLLNAGYDFARMSKWMGHGDISTTVNLYSHLSIEAKRETADTLSAVLGLGDKKSEC